MLRVHLVALALAATTLAATGCGGSSKSGSTGTSASPTTTTAAGTTAPATVLAPAAKVKVASGKPLTRAQWIAKADAICARFKTETSMLRVKFAAEYARTLPQQAAYLRVEVARLAKLVPPASDAREWQQFLDASLQWAEGDIQMLKYANQGAHILTSPVARATIAVFKRVRAIAKRSGLNACSL